MMDGHEFGPCHHEGFEAECEWQEEMDRLYWEECERFMREYEGEPADRPDEDDNREMLRFLCFS